MIVTDVSKLRVKCASTSIEQCEALKLFETLEQEIQRSKRSGVGLAAPQIGHYLRACIIRMPDYNENGKHRQGIKLNMINPVIEKGSGSRKQCEGCLSLPGQDIETERNDEVTVSWMDYDRKIEQHAVFYGWEAVCVQHEIDHLEGILIIDRALVKKDKVGRNDPCPDCAAKGVQIKYKKCKEHFKG